MADNAVISTAPESTTDPAATETVSSDDVVESAGPSNGATATDTDAVSTNSDQKPSTTTESELLAEFRESEGQTDLIDIINSMEADRKKFLAHVRSKISCKESEFEVRDKMICLSVLSICGWK